VAPFYTSKSAAAAQGSLLTKRDSTQRPSATQKLAEGAAEYNRHRPARPQSQRRSVGAGPVAL